MCYCACTFIQTDDMRREALKIELSEKLNELEHKMRKAMAWKVCSSSEMLCYFFVLTGCRGL